MLKKDRNMINAQSVVILFILTGMLFSQPDTLWTKTYGGGLWDYGWDVYELSNKDLLIIGSTASFGAGYYDLYLIRTDSLGDTIWTKTYGTSDNEFLWSSCKGYIGEYYIVGYKGLIGSGNESVYLFKTNENGDSLWARTYFLGEPSYGFYICPTSDNNYLICATLGTLGCGSEDACIIKVNGNGDTLWTWRFIRAGSQIPNAACNTFDGNYLIDAGDEYADICLIKMTPTGDTLWSRRYGGTPPRQCAYITQTLDSNYIIVGYRGEYGSGEEDVYLLKVDENGDSIWTRIYGGDTSDYGAHIYAMPDTNYLVVGWTRSYGATPGDVYFFKTTNDGGILWTLRYGGNELDCGRRISPIMDGGYLIIGYTESYGAGLADVYLIRLGQEPGISENQRSIKIIAPNLINYPNPAASNCVIHFQTEFPGLVSLEIYDASGRLVRRLMNERKDIGKYTAVWDGTDEHGKGCPAGVYFVQLESGGAHDVGKIILVR